MFSLFELLVEHEAWELEGRPGGRYTRGGDKKEAEEAEEVDRIAVALGYPSLALDLRRHGPVMLLMRQVPLGW